MQRRRHEALVHHQVGEAGRVEVERRHRSAARQHVDALHADVRLVPIRLAALEPDAVEEPPLLEREGAVADEVAGFRPVLPRGFAALDARDVDGRSVTKRVRSRKNGVGFSSVTSKVWSSITRRPDLREIRIRAFVEVLRALHVVELVSVFGGGLRRERALPRSEKIARGHGVAVAPLRIVPQVESIDAAIRRNVPALRHAGLRRGRGVKRREALEERVRDAAIGLAGDQRGVDRLGFRAIEKNEVRAIQRAPAAGEREGADEEGKKSGGRGHGSRGHCTNRLARPRRILAQEVGWDSTGSSRSSERKNASHIGTKAQFRDPSFVPLCLCARPASPRSWCEPFSRRGGPLLICPFCAPRL